MGRKFLMYGFGAIALYLAVEHFTGFSSDVNASASGTSNLIKAFQGR
jgi:hypothetical protein